MEETNILKKNTAILSIISNSILIVIKIIAGILSGSFSIISEAVHSSTDFLASLIAYYAVKKSAISADKNHQFGHGKFEDLSGFFEGMLINFAALLILYEGFKKILTNNYEVINTDIAVYVMVLSVIINFFISKRLFKVAKQTGSVALFADGEHLRTDIYTSLGIIAGMILIKLTDMHIVDSLIAIIVAVMIFQAGLKICKKTLGDLLDEGLPDEDIKQIQEIVKSFQHNGILDLCKIKTRTSGPRKNIELIIYAKASMTVKESHEICNNIEDKLKESFGEVDTIIHIEPKCNAVAEKLN